MLGFHHVRTRALRALVALLIGLTGLVAVGAVGAVTAAPAGAAPGTCNIWWTGATNSTWTGVNNWSLVNGGPSAGRIPAANEFVCMSTTPVRANVTYPTGTRTVAGLDFSTATSLTLQSGTLNLGSAANGAYDSTIRNLTVGTATLGGTAAVTLVGDNSSAPSIGNLSGAGVVTVQAGATYTVLGGLLVGKQLVNRGTLRYRDCNNYINMSSSTIDNYGTFDVAPTCDSFINDYDDTVNAVINRPGATLVVNPGAGGTFTIVPTFTNNGSVQLTSGLFVVRPQASDTGTYDTGADPATTLRIDSGGTLTASPGTFTGAGWLQTNGGGLVLAGGVSLSRVAVGGSVSGSGTVTSSLIGTGYFSGSGTLTMAAGSTNRFDTMTLSNGYTVLNQGTTAVDYAELYNGSTYENAALTTNVAGNNSYGFAYDEGPSNRVLNDAGATFRIELVDTGSSYRMSSPFTNQGAVTVVKGALQLSSVTNLVGGTLSGPGTWSTAGSLGFPANIVTNNTSITLVGTGSTNLGQLATNNGTLITPRSITTSKNLVNTGTLTLTGGTLQAVSYRQSSGTTTVGAGANLRGGSSGIATITIDGGTLTGAGTIIGGLFGAGTFQPGGVGGPMTVSGSWSPGATSTTAIQVSGSTTAGSDYGKISVSSTATLSGTLAISTAAGYLPPVGTTYRILDSGTRSGTWSAVTGVNLPNGTYYDLTYDASGAVLTVRQDPGVSAGDVSTPEGASGTSVVNVPVTLDAPSARSVSVDYTTVAQTATAGDDYVSTTGTLTFAPGETAKTVSVAINGDTFFEPDETFLLRLSNPVNTTVARAEATVTITNDDEAPTAPTVTAVSPSAVGQGASGVRLTISGSQFSPTSNVSFARAGITKVAGSQQVVDANTITLTIGVAASMSVGDLGVTVTTTSGSGTCASCLTITPKASATAVSPSLGAGAKERDVTVTGTDIQPGAIIKTAVGTVTSTSFVDSTSVEAVVSVPGATAPGTYAVTITNPDGGTSKCTCLVVVPRPTLTSISPATIARGGKASVTLTGTNFTAGAKLTGPAGVSFDGIVVVNPTTITARMSAASNAKLGANQTVTVTNPRSAGYGVGGAPALSVTATP